MSLQDALKFVLRQEGYLWARLAFNAQIARNRHAYRNNAKPVG